MAKRTDSLLSLAHEIAAHYSRLSQAEAIALGGSGSTGSADHDSDIDLYVYWSSEIPISARAEIATARAEYVEIDNQFWESGDEWIDADTGVHVDVMFRSVGWIEAQLDRLLRHYEASVGYSTCLWYNVLSSQVLYDRAGWFQGLQQVAQQPYPEGLRHAIIAKNHPILRSNVSSYLAQIERAVARGDLVSINHRTAAMLASYFDILFAVNRLPHPGEKRLVKIASEECAKLPVGMREGVHELIQAVSHGDRRVVEKADALIHGLDDLLREERWDSTSLEIGPIKRRATP